MKKNCIITASDAKYGDFLIDHWFRSLTENADLSGIDVVVLDYGLSTAQRFYLEQHEVRLVSCEKDGHVVVIRFRDMADFLSRNDYAQAALSDGGDIIFQDDIAPIFSLHPDSFRGVQEDLRSGFGIFLTDEFFSKQDKKLLSENLMAEEMVNAGFIVGPGDGMRRLGETVDRMVRTKTKFGPDQLVVNYLFQKEGFEPLPRRYNYVIATARADLKIREGRFYADDELVAVVHNTGNFSFLRPVENFGYGKERNQLKHDLLKALKALHTTSDTFYETRSALRRNLKMVAEDLSEGYHKSQAQLEESWEDFRKLFLGDDE